MKILDLISFIDARVPYTYYANDFPTSGSSDDCAVVKLTSGFPTREWSGVKQPAFQIMVRGAQNSQADCESKAYEIHDALTNLHEVTIGTDSVIAIRAMNSVPFFIGVDNDYRPIYSMNFSTVVRP